MIESNQRLLSEITARAVDEGVTLPFDVTRPAEGFISRELVIKPLPAEMMEAVRELAARHRVDTDSVYRAAFAAVLFRYSGSDRIDLWHDRTDGNLAVHELHRTADTRFTDLLTQAPPRPWRAGEDRDIELLVVDSAHPRPREIFATRHVRLALVPPARDQDRPLLLYDGSLFKDSTIDRSRGHLLAALQAMLEDPEQTLDAPNLIAEPELVQITETFNRTEKVPGLEHPLTFLALHAERIPSKVAYRFRERQTSFSELESRTRGLAAALLDAGLKPDEVVGVRLERSDLSAITLLAIWRAGGVYIPIDLSYPLEHVGHITEDNGLHLVVCETEQARSLGAMGLTPIDPSATGSERELRPPQDLEQPAVVMYTSGSTGRPKGITHSHASLLNRFGWLLQRYPIEDDEVLLQRTNINFIPSLWEIVAGIFAGCETLIVPDETTRDPVGLCELAYHYGATRMGLVPALLTAILESVPDVERKLAGLRLINIAGEPLPSHLVETLLHHLPDLRVVNDYGSTETNGVLSCDDREPFTHRRLVPAGRPIANVRAYVLDTLLRPVPIGVKGSLHITMATLPRGYVNLESATRERFFEHDFGNGRKERLYHTGDIARFLDDGRIEVLGRSDNVVKICGIRVELEGIEAQLAAHPELRECAVAVHQDDEGNKRLVAYLVTESGRIPCVAELRAYLGKRLPEYMLPHRYLRVDSLPRTANGKLARATVARGELTAEPLPFVRSSDQEQPAEHEFAPSTDYLQVVMEVLSQVLGIPLEGDAAKITFSVLGLDSLLAVTFMERLGQRLGRTLNVTLLFAHTSPSELVAHLQQEQAEIEMPAKVSETARPASGKAMEIAVIGMSGRFPDAPNLDRFWENLVGGVDSVTEKPSDRWSWDEYYDPNPSASNKSISKWGAFMDGIDRFDPMFFQISPMEARLMDPQQRLLLEESCKAAEDAGYNEQSADGLSVGVYIGARPGDYQERIAGAGHTLDARCLLGNDSAILAARIAYYLNLHGPAVTIDTACSSSLVAVYLACQALVSGECEAALAGGVSLVTSPTIYIANSNAGMLSPKGRCSTFDDAADGFVQGEGVGVLVLKPLAKALADGDRVYGIIRAGGINQDGKSNGITAPSGASQNALIRDVYRRYGIDPGSIQYVEAHGTGTKLGDPIEVEALTRAYSTAELPAASCALGSVKTNIGHLIAAAGAASLIKVLLAMRAQRLPPSLHFNTPNRHIDFASSPFFVNTESREWKVPEGVARRAAISSFGFSGTNCHLVCEEAPAQPPKAAPARPYVLLPLAAKSDEALAQRLGDLAAWTESHPGADLGDLAYSLWRRLSAHPRRCALVVHDPAELREVAARVRDGGEHSAYLRPLSERPVLHGSRAFARFAEGVMQEIDAPGSAEEVQDSLQALGELYIHGQQLHWEWLYPRERHNLLSLPGYPFAAERYWIEPEQTATQTAEPTAQLASRPSTARPRALLEQVESDSRRVLYVIGFDGSEYVLKHHVIQGQPVLPGAAQMEILARVVGEAGGRTLNHIRDLTWSTPYRYHPQAKPLNLEVRGLDRVESEFEFHSPGETNPLQRRVHAKGRVVWDQGDARLGRRVDLRALVSRCPEEVKHKAYYQRLSRQGIEYGPRFRCIRTYRRGEGEALAWVASDRRSRPDGEERPFLPEIMDAVWQAASGLLPEPVEQPALPFSIGEIEWRRLPDNCLVYVRRLSEARQTAKGIYRFQVLATDRDNRAVLLINDFVLRRASSGRVRADRTRTRLSAGGRVRTYAAVWQPDHLSGPPPVSSASAAVAGPVMGIALSDAAAAVLAETKTTAVLAGVPWIDVKAGEQADMSTDDLSIRVTEEGDYRALLERLTSSDRVPRSILLVLDPVPVETAQDVPRALDSGFYPLLWLAKAFLEARPTEPVKLLVARLPVAEEERGRLSTFPVLGALAKTLKLENPRLQCSILDLSEADVAVPETLVSELAAAGEAAEISYRGRERLTRINEVLSLPEASDAAHGSLSEGGVYLVTGGLGGIGLELARYLVERYRACVVLVGRKSYSADETPLPPDLRNSRTESLFLTADVSRQADVARVMRQIDSRFGRLDGIFHSAGVTRDALLINKTAGQVREVLAAKLDGALNLRDLLNMATVLKPEVLVLFSSISGTTGTPGQTDYAFANAFLDELARHGEQEPSRLVSVGWSLWETGGMRPAPRVVQRLEIETGMVPMPSADGFAALEAALASGRPQVLVTYGDPVLLDAHMGVDRAAGGNRPPVVAGAGFEKRHATG